MHAEWEVGLIAIKQELLKPQTSFRHKTLLRNGTQNGAGERLLTE